MDVIKKIEDLLKQRGWSQYQLAKRAGLPRNTVYSWCRKGTIPSIDSLQYVCSAFGITLSQFFIEDGNAVTLTEEQMKMLDRYSALTETQKEKVDLYISGMLQN